MIDQIKKMDKKSDEFFEIYKAVNEKYFDFDEPDEYQRAAQFVNLLLNAADEWMLVMVHKLANELFQMVDQKSGARHGSFVVKDEREVFFDLYTDKSALANLGKALRNNVMVQAKQSEDDK